MKEPRKPQKPPRYAVQRQRPSGGVTQTIGITRTWKEAIEWAKNDEALGLDVWVLNLKTGAVVYGKVAMRAKKAGA
jgi:hypothetical protein